MSRSETNPIALERMMKLTFLCLVAVTVVASLQGIV